MKKTSTFLVLGLVLAACRGEPPRPRNVLLLSVDTLRADALGAAGYEAARTPTIDRLASEGTYFTAAVSTMPRTTPALASLMTGLWPHRHGSRDVGDRMTTDAPTLAEVLERRGFATLAVVANSSAGPKQALDRGFDRFVTYEELIETYGDGLYRDLTDVPPDQPGWATAVTDQGLELLSGVAEDEPWLLWLFYFDPHFLYRPPSPWQDGVEAGRCFELYNAYQDRREDGGQVFADIGGVASKALDDCRRLYDAEVAYVDREIGRLLGELARAGRLDDTLVVFTADHGENFGEGGLFFEHGDNAHGAGLDVPLVFRGPGVAAGRRDGGAVSLVDVTPTVLDLLRIEERPGTDGESLADRLRPGEPATDEKTDRRVVFAESATAIWNEAFDQVITGRTWWRVCINSERFTLCEIPNKEPGVLRLYDHQADPELRNDVAAEHPEVVETLRHAWESWPPESARHRVAQTARFKLVQSPHLAGGYDARLYDLEADPDETTDVRERYPDVYRYLLTRLEQWGSDIPAPPPREADPELEETLRTLGYVK